MPKNLKITATPGEEDFLGKYEASGRVGNILVGRYFLVVEGLIAEANKERTIKKALEIGCGAGYSTQKLAKMLPSSASFEASDYVGKLVTLAKKNNPKLNIIQEDIYELKRKDETYDLVFLLEVLEHLDHPDVALAEVRRVLKPGGLLIAGVPREPIWRGLNMSRGKYLKTMGNTPGHLNNWSSASFTRFINKHFGRVLKVRQPLPWTILLSKTKK